ncbi:trimethylamine corrinoid protein 2 [Clostridium thermosuccinogenes]|uniref:Trimethylamine corrinoid protein 2 n=1 Tax=Clostridium thermosuccinogenes TaxID=84032 RepID=A0A2K2FKX6_9CLOT|nr:trimethylamine corrinoid protein 2 [Pseudoclostridium thermosuccinogenes]AUS96056.1 trimethylamine corrinoid protein 2 [Pseudoclostridium thermosuccinogenes]PNT99444.1 trimethylamine corrinoid protein 2 [Pseudoclostridium thermosuccinogenes]PNU01131.1 trimethylamine corrinoid protein 2 [Pseudoclostridium thermosuccinogenes]
MYYIENWDKIQKRFEEFWARENHDRPIISIKAPKNRQTAGKLPSFATLKERWLDTEYMLQEANLQFQNTFYAGEAFAALNPNLGPDLFAACYGTELEFGEDTSWAIHSMTDSEVEEYKGLVIEKQGFYYQKILEMTRAAVEDGKDKYVVGVTDLHPAADALVSLRGPETLCIDTIDNPQFVRKATLDLFEGFKQIFTDLCDITTKYQKGTTNWMGIWHPKRWYVTSCDFCCMISTDMFEDLFMEELEKELDFLDASIFHLDGPGALRHLDRLLQIEKLKGIQWVYGAGQPTASHWLEVLKKIQNAGKLIQVAVEPQELDVMLENLAPEGVMYVINADSEDQAKELMKKAEQYKRKVF